MSGWKPVPSVARVTRDAVSGLLKEIEVMLSGRQYPIDVLTRLWLARHVQNQSRITPMRRICSFHGFFLFNYDLSAPAGRNDCHGLSLAGGNPAPYRRKNNP